MTLKGEPPGGYEPEEKLTREQALRAYTLDAAYGAFEEKVKGSIQTGKLADFTVFSQDIMKVDEMMRKPMPVGNLSGLSEDQKFENLYHLIQLMKSDGQVFKSEMHFCEEIAEKLGYKRQVISELSSKIYSDPSITSDRRELMSRAHKFIVK